MAGKSVSRRNGRPAAPRPRRSRPPSVDPYAILGVPAALELVDDVKDVLRLIAEAATSVLAVPLSAVVPAGRGAPSKRIFGQFRGASLEPGLARELRRFVASPQADAQLFSAEAVVEVDVQEEAPKLADHSGLGRLLVVRLGRLEGSFGSLILGKSSGEPFASEERAAAETLAALASMALYRVRGEGAWDEGQEGIRAIVDTAVDAIITIDEDGTIKSFNPASERLFGYSADEVISKTVSMLAPPPYRDEHDGYIANYLKTGEQKIIGIGREVVGRRKDGTTFPMDLAVSEVRVGERRTFTGILRDISERKRAEEDLRDNEERLRSLARRLHVLNRLMRVAVSSLDMTEIFEGIADQVKQLIRHDRLSISLRPLDADHIETYLLVAKDSRIFDDSGTRLPLDETPMGEAILTGHLIVRRDMPAECVYPIEFEMAKEAGLRSLMCVPLESKGRVIGSLNLGSTRPNEYDEQEFQVAREIADHLAVIVEHALLYEESQALAALRERTRLAHELHDAVAQSFIGIVLELDLAERTMMTDAAAAKSELGRARQMAHEGLEGARRSILALRPRALEQSSLHEAVVREIEARAPDNVIVNASVSGRPVPVSDAMETAFFRIAREASSNILRHSNATRIDALLDYGEDAVTLTITDDGVGFDVRAVGVDPEARELSEAGGFGLTGMHERARAVGGELKVESKPGRGTRVTARMPYTGAAAPRAEPQPEESAPSDAPRPIRVLLADDHAVARQGILRMLEEAPDIEVVAEAGDGAEALAKARALRPDLLLADVRMPRMGGIEVVAKLREEGLAIPAIILTAYLDGRLISEAMKAGAQGYLLKDVGGPELVNSVRAVHMGETLLQRTAASELARRVRDSGQLGPVEALTTREHEVLELLSKGLRNKEIALALGLTEATIKFHATHIFEKLGVGGRTEALAKSIKMGIISPQ